MVTGRGVGGGPVPSCERGHPWEEASLKRTKACTEQWYVHPFGEVCQAVVWCGVVVQLATGRTHT